MSQKIDTIKKIKRYEEIFVENEKKKRRLMNPDMAIHYTEQGFVPGGTNEGKEILTGRLEEMSDFHEQYYPDYHKKTYYRILLKDPEVPAHLKIYVYYILFKMFVEKNKKLTITVTVLLVVGIILLIYFLTKKKKNKIDKV